MSGTGPNSSISASQPIVSWQGGALCQSGTNCNMFQDWLKSLSVCLALVQTAVSQPHNQLYRGKVGLCVSQVIKVLTLFRSLLCSPPCRQTVWYLSERLRWCVSELRRVLSGAGTEQDRDGAGSVSFLHQVDHALQQLNHSDLEGWKQIVDDMVCQAISVAKIASSIDYNEITSVCHRLLDESNQLACESDQRQVTLLKDSLAACLSSLEQRVNIAVLRLFLQVFSEPNGPVKRLVHCCGQALHTQRRTDLDSLVAELDAHIERIILVGQFAVSCCEDKGKVAAMRCCMASLESVDNYLVPAITAFYLTPDCVNKRAFVKFLCDHWQHQLTSLQSHLDSIIDSYAFSQVVQDSMEVLSKDLKGESDAVLEASQVIVRHGWLLYKHLSRSSDVSVASDVLDELKKALHKCEVAVTKQAHTSTITRQTKLILDSVDHICDQLSVSTASCAAVDGSCTADSPGKAVNSIRDLPLDISFQSLSASQFNSYRPQWLKNKISEMKENRQIRILNLTEIIRAEEEVQSSTRTPRRTETVNNALETPKGGGGDWLTPFLSHKAERNTTLYVRTPRALVQSRVMDKSTSAGFGNLTEGESSSNLALDITDILESLSTLADTLSSEMEANNWTLNRPTPLSGELKRHFSGESFNSHWFSQVSGSLPSDINTPDRLQDLAFLDEKLEKLKEQS
ncbi:serendipity locus protein alpha-like isoform X3 [Homalodisca vitripennis]|uniref:serendipity locus protein alpha-like isoform X3 n=1 Tax=Homalodisca vitripennis TaxID=197043 RepID=UPI001EEC7F9D|nr:serendipity locus protein alpha-like isoform X3 [Homalodisca vitripennis]